MICVELNPKVTICFALGFRLIHSSGVKEVCTFLLNLHTQHWNGVSILCLGNWIMLYDKTIYCKNAFFLSNLSNLCEFARLKKYFVQYKKRLFQLYF